MSKPKGNEWQRPQRPATEEEIKQAEQAAGKTEAQNVAQKDASEDEIRRAEHM
jgi:hypothetical protein